MNVKRSNAMRAVAASAVIAALAFVLLVQYAPDSVAFSPNNYGWNGLQGVASAYGVGFVTTVAALPAGSVLVIAQPSMNFSRDYALAVRSFLSGGGTVLVADKSGVADSLLSQIGSAISVQSKYSVVDSTYNWRSKSVPTALVLSSAKSRFPFLANVTGIALNRPAPLAVSPGGEELAVTSQFSAAPGDGSGQGPFAVMAAQKVGRGTLLVVGDSQFLLNSEWTIADNGVLIGNLFANAHVYFDASHWGVSSIAQLKSEFGEFYGFVSGVPMRYVATLFVVGAALALAPRSGPRPFNDEGEGQDD